ncbi:MAG: menaquinone biosynthesis protein [Armatimonadetes bacterium]|nr:menaquinone biosynthesis protein [Armatimonadota bacterium]
MPYLNGEPLAAALRDRAAFPHVELVTAVPSELLAGLLRGQLDAALVSVAGVLAEPELRILPGYGVTARGAVQSIQLYARVPLAEVRSVALDASSRSGTALTRLLFAARYRARPEFFCRPPDLEQMLAEADAVLLIGDPCLRASTRLDAGDWSGPVPTRVDLGAEWERWIGLPFVYAVWAAPAHGDLPRLAALFERAAHWGLPRAADLARAGAAATGLSEDAAVAYLTNVIRYPLAEPEMAGLRRFCDLCRQHGVLPPDAAARLAPAG